jgi:glycosyltransferase involved in cell wall biosynthesis
MRIAHFIDTPRRGGAERVLEHILAACVRADHDTTLLSPQEWLLDEIAAAVPGLRTRVTGTDAYASAAGPARRAAKLATALPDVSRALRRLGPDVLHVHNGGYPGSDLCRIAVIAGGLVRAPRRVLTIYAAPRSRAESYRWIQTAVDAAVWRANQTVISATTLVAGQLRELRGLPASQGPVRIPWGVPEPGGAAESEAFRAQVGAGPGDLLAGMVAATDDAQKGHLVLVEALGLAPGVRGVVAGAPLPAAAASRAAELGLGDRLAALGRMPRIGPLYHAIDVLVAPSVADESLPLVILEAMACAKPVVASRLSGIPEAVVDGVTGRLFTPGDASALAAALTELAAGPERRRILGDAGRESWEREFSLEAMTQATLALYAAPAAPAASAAPMSGHGGRESGRYPARR